MNYLKISLSAFALILMGFSVNAQSCSDSKAKTSACCAKKATNPDNSSSSIDGATNAVLVANTTDSDLESKSFKVYGNCGMCKNRIESALKDVKAIQSADWNVDTKMLSVKYDSEGITLDEIQKKITAVGHDAGNFRADDSVYNELPGCCQYDRADTKT